MKVKELIKDLPGVQVQGKLEQDVSELFYDSRLLTPGSLFFCIKGFKFDGHRFAGEAAAKGAKVLVVEDEVSVSEGVAVIKVPDARKAMALMSAAFYYYPARDLKLTGVTGTNGKTTITYMLDDIFKAQGYTTGLIGTLNVIIDGKIKKSEHTTPESLDLQRIFSEMRAAGVKYVSMEVSSHSLALERVYGCEFEAAVFTNLTQDHLDFHKDFEDYFETKLKLFKQLKPAGQGIVNRDDDYGEKLLVFNPSFISYALKKAAVIKGENLSCSSEGSTFKAVTPWGSRDLRLNLKGKFNVYNALGALGAALTQGLKFNQVCDSLEQFSGVKGRFENIKAGQDFLVLIDYAHTPDALNKVLLTAREITKGKLICVFGCGGDRDPKKRTLMGQIAGKHADLVIITSDNPRTEEPLKIIAAIEKGVMDCSDSYLVEPDRRKAINSALSKARTEDCVVIAGKGHEDYQILSTGTIHFDDAEVVKEYFHGVRGKDQEAIKKNSGILAP
jgi:UDP-N-acetylmuramoyl-L-alanyl-D-glutamate--2,6-diaminopimelate ligase